MNLPIPHLSVLIAAARLLQAETRPATPHGNAKVARRTRANLGSIPDQDGHAVRVTYADGRLYFRRLNSRRCSSIDLASVMDLARGQGRLPL